MWDPRESTPSWFLEWLALWALLQAVFSGCLNQPKSISLIPMYCQYIQITSPQDQICKEHQPSLIVLPIFIPHVGKQKWSQFIQDLAFKNPPFSQKSLPLGGRSFAICPVCPGSPICGHKWKLSPSMKNLRLGRGSNDQLFRAPERVVKRSWKLHPFSSMILSIRKLQCEAPKIANLVYNSSNYCLWYL